MSAEVLQCVPTKKKCRMEKNTKFRPIRKEFNVFSPHDRHIMPEWKIGK